MNGTTSLLLGHGSDGGDELPDQDGKGGGPAHLLLRPQLLRGPGQLVRHHDEGGGQQGLGAGGGAALCRRGGLLCNVEAVLSRGGGSFTLSTRCAVGG